MVGKYKGVQSHIIQENSFAILSPCGCNTLNLCGTDSAECCLEAITLFGTIQSIYTKWTKVFELSKIQLY